MTKTISSFEYNRAAFDYCRAITKRSSKTFFTAFSNLPPERANSIYAVYAFCRTADDLVDIDHDSAGLQELHRDLSEFASGQVPDQPLWRALAVVFDVYDMNLSAFFEMIDGQERDVNFKQPETQQDLEDYCYYVAGTVGLMVLPILSVKHKRINTQAINLGIAMQLTNILRDVGEDYQQGRIYFPRELMSRYHLNAAGLNTRTPSSNFIKLWEYEAHLAMSKYDFALSMLPEIDTVAQPSLLAATYLYRELLTVAREQNYPILNKPVSLSTKRKKKVLKESMKMLKNRH
ncbi:phytoene/squalene synthase family protein [Lacticaseibacillus paracasei]|uniref:phytoene/squalene synthase family protein n=1 Tax=Lacticaseibacillus paracasei TaxID=1597 RepID=UPI0010AE5E7D|nr:phytoene/squalene synthase family protein [Lacticaseibacillus paracasei]TJY19349.1 phytoene/squalene synthase family protein [Lacticaseibacillus paracasei]